LTPRHPDTATPPLRHIVIIGYRASGKTSTGRILARSLTIPFVDLDERLAAKLGVTIAQAFTRFGEPWFRAAECVELEGALAEPVSVIALGGGTPCSPAGAAMLARARADGRAKVVYLRASPGTLRTRLLAADNAHRPALTGAAHPADEVDEVLSRRQKLYQDAADAVIDVDQLTPAQAAGAIGELVRTGAP